MILEIYGIWATGQDRESEKEDEMGVINKCTQCGKKGLFLPLNNLGHCEECIKKNKAERARKAAVEADAEAMRKAAEEAARKAEEEANTKHVPIAINRTAMSYFYRDVSIFTKLNLPEVRVDLNGVELNFVQEPENEYDAKAVAIYTIVGEKVGYLYKGKLQDMANDYLRMGFPVWGAISSIDTDENKYQICVAFYRNGHGMDAHWDDDSDWTDDDDFDEYLYASSRPVSEKVVPTELLDEAVAAVLENGCVSVPFLQRKLRIGYARAAQLVDAMTDLKVISGFNGNEPRQLLISSFEDYQQHKAI